MLRNTRITLAAAAALLSTVAAHAEWLPERPVEFIVASGAGGGTDNFARTIQSIVTKHNLMEQPIVVLNKGSGSGAEAFIYAKANAGDPHKLIFGTNNVYLLPHVAKLAYTTEDLAPVAALALDEFLIWVKADSEYKDAKSLIEAAKANPGQIPFGGSQSKDTDETLVALIEQETGADFKYVPFNGGGEVGVQLAGGHIAANVNNPNENLGQWQGAAIRPLCVFSPERMAKGEPIQGDQGWSDIPTCSEAGLPIESYQMPRTVWAPAGLPEEALAFYSDLLKKVSETPEWKDYLAKTSQTGRFLAGSEFEDFIAKSQDNALKVFKAEGWLVQ
ncbi:tripartite tricarboxylate transporter substrate binding protein [Pseudaminobacter sp. 19-2017]|uniref:Tripartite tricarboxylate transporter substrate binding protein n=1 Tax=Pseudaminobacter soli (ex Zhang et al. 2022) TaxID=2831468 RepID=A0A942IBM3_9HYPH|nr:tripartite tricarboxylate transporter substrate binding protein [Pseudaminobacter soli]MBS3651756.1 tripartite tricarboxylate transporter substrate binding protein [Pseudaminobacter soli]